MTNENRKVPGVVVSDEATRERACKLIERVGLLRAAGMLSVHWSTLKGIACGTPVRPSSLVAIRQALAAHYGEPAE